MSELSYFLIILTSYASGVIIGWAQRDRDKKRDAKINTQAWLRDLELYEPIRSKRPYPDTILRDLYQGSLKPNKLTRIK